MSPDTEFYYGYQYFAHYFNREVSRADFTIDSADELSRPKSESNFWHKLTEPIGLGTAQVLVEKFQRSNSFSNKSVVYISNRTLRAYPNWIILGDIVRSVIHKSRPDCCPELARQSDPRRGVQVTKNEGIPY